jgi:hypothetical protein
MFFVKVLLTMDEAKGIRKIDYFIYSENLFKKKKNYLMSPTKFSYFNKSTVVDNIIFDKLEIKSNITINKKVTNNDLLFNKFFKKFKKEMKPIFSKNEFKNLVNYINCNKKIITSFVNYLD